MARITETELAKAIDGSDVGWDWQLLNDYERFWIQRVAHFVEERTAREVIRLAESIGCSHVEELKNAALNEYRKRGAPKCIG